jgi:hypothetical protein
VLFFVGLLRLLRIGRVLVGPGRIELLGHRIAPSRSEPTPSGRQRSLAWFRNKDSRRSFCISQMQGGLQWSQKQEKPEP